MSWTHPSSVTSHHSHAYYQGRPHVRKRDFRHAGSPRKRGSLVSPEWLLSRGAEHTPVHCIESAILIYCTYWWRLSQSWSEENIWTVRDFSRNYTGALPNTICCPTP